MDRRSFVIGTAAAATGLAAAPGLAQQPYPSHPITFINPFPPGGAADVVGRPFAAVLEPDPRDRCAQGAGCAGTHHPAAVFL